MRKCPECGAELPEGYREWVSDGGIEPLCRECEQKAIDKWASRFQ